MLLARNCSLAGCSSRLLLLPATVVPPRQCTCNARRGRPSRKTEDAVLETVDEEPAPAKRKGRKKKTEVEPAPTAAEAPLTVEMQPEAEHERVVSIEDMTSSVELDYTDNPTLIVPSYTHQAQGHESATQPPLDNFVPNFDSSGFVGSEELPRQEQQTPAAAHLQQQEQPQQQQDGLPQLDFLQQELEMLPMQDAQQQQQDLLHRHPDDAGLQVMQQQQLVGPEVGAAAAAEDDDDELLGYDDPPGLFDYEAGLAYAVTEPPPAHPLQHLPQRLRPKSRRQADYMLRYLSYLGNVERQEREDTYKDRALYYHLQQVKESENVYLSGKALSVVMAEIELEDAQTGNRTDSFYPIWARAEHRWYPSGRFAAYNEYIKENLPDLTVKYAPGADQEEDFDIMDDVLLMADDPSMPGGGDDEDGMVGNPAAGLSIDSFMGPGMLPGAGGTDLGQSYLEDVLPAGDEEVEEELLE